MYNILISYTVLDFQRRNKIIICTSTVMAGVVGECPSRYKNLEAAFILFQSNIWDSPRTLVCISSVAWWGAPHGTL